MKPYLASLLNAIILIAIGLWGYLGSETPSYTALIPVGAGIILILLNKGVMKENKVIAHIAVVLTLLILIALIKPLTAGLERSDNMAVIRVIAMMLSTLFAIRYFVKSFVDARKNSAKD